VVGAVMVELEHKVPKSGSTSGISMPISKEKPFTDCGGAAHALASAALVDSLAVPALLSSDVQWRVEDEFTSAGAAARLALALRWAFVFLADWSLCSLGATERVRGTDLCFLVGAEEEGTGRRERRLRSGLVRIGSFSRSHSSGITVPGR